MALARAFGRCRADPWKNVTPISIDYAIWQDNPRTDDDVATVGGALDVGSENQSIYIPLGAVHRLENPRQVSMVLIEVQTGAYLGEDDITRYEDAYDRS